MAKKSFAGARKPGRQPTAEEIERFETTGKPVNTETRKAANAPSRVSASTRTLPPKTPPSQIHADTETQKDVKPEGSAVEATVRLTIDLPEGAHTRFKSACAATRRKMVQEVRIMIEARTAELESQA